MKKTILCLALMLISQAGSLFAQDGNYSAEYRANQNRSKTDKTFNIWTLHINLRDIVQLKDAKMTLEMQNITDFENFKKLDSILMNFMKDIAFYKDSLDMQAAGHVRIDYVISPEYSFKKIRFKKYYPDGDIYINRSGETSKLKLEQDTIHIIVEKLLHKSKCAIPYNIQATFVLDNYTDVDKIIADRAELHRILDTLEKENRTKQTDKPHRYPEMTIVYNPYFFGPNSFIKRKGVDAGNLSLIHDHDYINFNANVGAGVVLNTVAPFAEFGASLISQWLRGTRTYSFYKMFASSYYFFERDAAGNISVKDNWFINASVGTNWGKAAPGWVGHNADFGVGYLVSQKGNYFKSTTFKVFTDIRLANGINLSPEFIFTNNFKQIYPGISLKVF